MKIVSILFVMAALLTGCGVDWFPATNSSSNVASANSHQMGGAIQGTPLSLSQAVSTFAGVSPGSTDGTGAAARFYVPASITTDGTNLFVSDTGNNTIRQVVIATGAVTTLAGSAGTAGSA